jgi:2-polyprenyl-3-methyl-5-hydroxy-6-metoxy-1,4-benzoquinol methylase
MVIGGNATARHATVRARGEPRGHMPDRSRRYAHRLANRAASGRALLRSVAKRADDWGRRLGLLPYRPERRTSAEWSAEYDAGALDYYGRLDELGRYSAVVGYVGWLTAEALAPPTLLDIGCGPGLLRRHLERVPLAEYVGIDLSEAAIRAAREQDFARSRFVVGDVGTTAERGPFDIVVLNEVLYYAADTDAFLEQLRSMLTDTGALVVSVWRHPGDKRLWQRVEDAFDIVDRVEVRNRANPVNARGWIIACCRPRT